MENNNGVYSHKVRAGKRRTYFFDVRATKYDDYFIVLTESKRRFDQDGYEKHKIFLYKEDFNKFMEGLNKVVNHVKTELMPNFDFEAFDREDKPASMGHSNHDNMSSSEENHSETSSEETSDENTTKDNSSETSDEEFM